MWKAYPHFSPPERFPPFQLAGGLFLVNAWENAASAMEMSAVAAKNCALLAVQHLRSAEFAGETAGLDTDVDFEDHADTPALKARAEL